MDTIVVGIDIGMTFTGVAYALHQRNLTSLAELSTPPIPYINRWPGRETDIANKTPTAVSVFSGSAPGDGCSPKWGFLCSHPCGHRQCSGLVRREKFKLLLEETFHDHVFRRAPPTHDEVKSWYRIYLRGLYLFILDSLGRNPELEKLKINFQQHRVIYSFSVATTWGPNSKTVNLFKQLIEEAGFGSIKNHSFRIGLTEAEAAAIATMMGPGLEDNQEGNQEGSEEDGVVEFQEDDIIIAADLGGGTSDVTTLRLTNVSLERDTKHPRYKMEQICTVDGVTIGSTNIDEAINDLIESRLRNIPQDATPWRRLPWNELQDMIILLKERYGEPGVMLLDTFHHNVIEPDVQSMTDSPKLLDSLTFDNLHIRCGRMTFSKAELGRIFDDVIKEIIDLIERQWDKKPDWAKKCYLALTGGLSTSKYVRKKLKEHFKDMKVLCPSEPTLSVCRGLVIDMLDQLQGRGSLITRRSRCSYGILHRERYNKAKHKGHLIQMDDVDKKFYAVNCIKWLINEDDLIIDNRHVKNKVTRSIPAKSEMAKWKEHIVAHRGKRLRPDYYLDNLGVEFVSDMDVNFKIEMKHINDKAVKNKYLLDWRGFGKRVWHISYTVGLKVGPADLGVELWYNGEKMCSNEVQLDLRDEYNDDVGARSSI